LIIILRSKKLNRNTKGIFFKFDSS
jgi:hypothetical protein